MQQVVDLQNSAKFQSLGVALLSISTDPADIQAPEALKLAITTPMLVDLDGKVTAEYGVDQYAMPNGEPSHTFVLVDQEGNIDWLKDYGAPDNPDRTMYVPVEELIEEIEPFLK